MMNEHQANLLELLKEIDRFCRKHEITYYCAAGTVLGAVRHGGFIPWDDDLDIIMPRREFLRFVQCFEAEGIPDRTVEYYEAGHGHYTVVNRYQKEHTTMFCRYHMTGRACAGTLLDVFCLDPIPSDYEGQRDALAKFTVYADLITHTKGFAHRLPAQYFTYYEKYAPQEGETVQDAVRRLSEMLLSYDDAQCGSLLLQWGSVPLIYPREMMGEPVYLSFEDMMIPVPTDWYHYLVIHYGSGWMQVPYVDDQGEHSNITRPDMDYDYFYQRRDTLFDQAELIDLHTRWKAARRLQAEKELPLEAYMHGLQNEICLSHIRKNLKSAAAAPQTLFAQKQYDAFIAIYEPYLQLQTGRSFMGAKTHGAFAHWMFPLIVPMEDATAAMLSHALLRSGQMRRAEVLNGVLIRSGNQSREVLAIRDLLHAINDSMRLYYTGAYEACLTAINAIPDAAEIPVLEEYRWLCRVRTGLTSTQRQALQECVQKEPERENLCKAWGDLLWEEGDRQEAAAIYDALLRTSRNGMFWKDIAEKGLDTGSIPIHRETTFQDTDVTRTQRKLLLELTELCDAHNISYVLHPQLAARLYQTGNLGYALLNRVVFMERDGAERLQAAFAQRNDKERSLTCWEDPERKTSYALIYSATDSVYCDFRHLEQWRDLGIYITIRILDREKTGLKAQLKGLLKSAQSTRSSGKLTYVTGLPGGELRTRTFREEDWKERELIRGEHGSYYIPRRAMKLEADLSNIPLNRSIYTYQSSEMTWADINPCIDDTAYHALDWQGYEEAVKQYRALNRAVDQVWDQMLAEGEHISK